MAQERKKKKKKITSLYKVLYKERKTEKQRNKIGSFIIKLIMKSIKYLIPNAPEFQRIYTIVTVIITTLIIIRWGKCHGGNQPMKGHHRTFCKS